MTLIQGIIRPDHIWICTDNRVSVENKFKNDNHVKYVGIRCSDGTALLSYTGLAELRDGTKMSDWVRTVIRGENRDVERTVLAVSDSANKEFGTYSPLSTLVFIIAAFVHSKAVLYEIVNIADKNSWNKPLRHFSIKKLLVDKPLYYSAGSGSSYITEEKKRRLGEIAANRPRNSKDFLNLLIEQNKKVSEKDKERVSSSCIAVEMSEKGEPINIVRNDLQHISAGDIPFVLFGIDTTEMMQLTLSQLPGGKNHNLSQEKINKIQDQNAIDAVTPRKNNK
jgi:hypothetical protein